MTVADALSALVNFMKQFPNELLGIEGETLKTVVHFALQGSVKQAKYATMLSCHLDQERTSSEIIHVYPFYHSYSLRKSIPYSGKTTVFSQVIWHRLPNLPCRRLRYSPDTKKRFSSLSYTRFCAQIAVLVPQTLKIQTAGTSGSRSMIWNLRPSKKFWVFASS